LGEKFELIVETRHEPDAGTQENVNLFPFSLQTLIIKGNGILEIISRFTTSVKRC